MSVRKAFIAYPEQPYDLSKTIQSACSRFKLTSSKTTIQEWPQMDIFGENIADQVRKNIESCDVLIADVTFENLNVYYEIGYAIGLGKSIAPIVNVSFHEATKSVKSDGFFDTIGFSGYENSDQLQKIFENLPDSKLIELYGRSFNQSQPLYILDTVRKTDFRNAIISAVKDSKVYFRSFDPIENARFATIHIIQEVTASSGIIVPLLSESIHDYKRHNLRAAFLAGMSNGLGKNTLLLQQDSTNPTVPLDYRDLVSTFTNERDIELAIKEFSISSLQSTQFRTVKKNTSKSKLQKLSLGASAAENEFRLLENYFVETSEYVRTNRGEVNVVSGRKGSGKTAIFFMVRDSHRQKRHSQVTDLKPESHQLSLFRQELLKLVDLGVFDHTLAAFWYFVFLSEMLFTIRRSYEHRVNFDTKSYTALQEIDPALEELGILESGDFTARIDRLAKFIVLEINSSKNQKGKLNAESLTNIVFRGGITKIKSLIERYSDHKTNFMVLFDNIDKGWPTNGVEEFDIRMVRIMLESLEKIRRDLHTMERSFNSVVFLRNDIYELLVEQTPDRGKAGQLRIDWNDRAKLRTIIHRRLQSSTNKPAENFPNLWGEYFVTEIDGRDSFEYCVDHCLMRPRFLITIIEYAIANAINRANTIVQRDDIIDAVRQHSNYLISEFGFEIRDASGLSADILFSLIGLPKTVSKQTVMERFTNSDIDHTNQEEAFRLLLWYGILGIVKGNGIEKYIYDYDYSIKRLIAETKLMREEDIYCINPSLHVALN